MAHAPLPALPDDDDDIPDLCAYAAAELLSVGAPPEYAPLLADEVLRCISDGVELFAEPRTAGFTPIQKIDHAVSFIGMIALVRGRSVDAKMAEALCMLARPTTLKANRVGGGRFEPAVTERLQCRRARAITARWLDAAPALDLAAGLAVVPGGHVSECVRRAILRTLMVRGRLDLRAHMDVAQLRVASHGGPDDTAGAWYWMLALGKRSFGHLLQVVERADDASAGPIALNLVRLLVNRLEHPTATDRDHVPEPSPIDVLRWVTHIRRRLETRPDDLALMASLWEIMRGDLTFELAESVELELAELTTRELSRFRKRVGSSADAAQVPWTGEAQHFASAIRALQVVAGHWRAVKATLLLLRSLPLPAVGPDLRHWHEAPDGPDGEAGPPVAWRWVPEMAVSFTFEWARTTRGRDPALVEIRTEFAEFCVERLKSRLRDKAARPASNDDMVEPDPTWRRGYVQALRSLRLDPGGRGHRTLHWLRANDPDEAVRAEAGVLYGEMIGRVTLPPGTSPLRSIMAAHLWLRWAHRLALRLPVDEAGMHRTRQKEIRRTKEVEQLFEEMNADHTRNG